MKQLSIKNQFRIGAVLIIVIAGIAVSLLVYQSLQSHLITTVQQKAQIFLNTASSIRIYIKDTLRPRVQQQIKSDRFLLESMSTSYISRTIMKLLKDEIPEFQYKRAAKNPRNSINLADDFELEKINWFEKNRDQKHWAGMITKNGKPYYTELMPIPVEKDCLHCHGDPKDAPQDMLDIYGSSASFGYSVGEVVAVDTIYIPMAYSNRLIKEQAWLVFLIGVALLFILIVTITILFNHTIVTKLRAILKLFQQIFDKSGEPIPIDYNQVGDEFEQVQEVFEQTADHLVIMHDELRNSERKYRQLFESSPDTIFICDAECHIQELNSAGLKLLEIDQNHQTKKSFSILDLMVHQKDKDLVMKTIKTDKTNIDMDLEIVTNSGKKIDVIFSANRLLDDRGSFTGVEGVIRDVTKRKQMNQYLAQTEKLASIGQLAAGIAHEINNPLGVIKCYSDLIHKNPDNETQIAEDIEVIQKHTQNCKTIVESLLNFARVSEPSFKKSDLHHCIDEILSVLSGEMAKQHIKVEKEYCQDIVAVDLDESKFKQVLMNLLLNGIHAMPDGGTFTIRTGYTDVLNQLFLDISDTGPGIPFDIQNKIFEPFFTTKTEGKGTGLGLSVSYGIIQQHRGNIIVFNNDQQGATFSIRLPSIRSNQNKPLE